MPTFMAVHKWPKEVTITCTKEMIAGFTAMLKGETPKDVILRDTWIRPDDGAFCCWDAPSKEALNKLFEQYLPTMLKYTEFVPVSKAYPPTTEYVLGLWQTIVAMSSKQIQDLATPLFLDFHFCFNDAIILEYYDFFYQIVR